MADTKLTDLAATTTLAAGDSLYVVDASDTTDDPAGSSKKITVANLETTLGIGDITGTETITGNWTFNDVGDGGLTSYDIEVGDTDGTPTYGMMHIGNAVFGRTSYNVGNLDLDGTLLLWNQADPASSNMEFCFVEGGTNDVRFAIATSGTGNATYSARSMLIAGPAVYDDTICTVGYWQGVGIFDNLVCNTGGDGADLGVQNDLEVEGDIFVDSIIESTTGAGVTIGSDAVFTTKTPASASATGTQGTIAWDTNFIYVCTATDTWKRVAIATW